MPSVRVAGSPRNTHAHERRRDFLGEADLDRLLSAAKRGRHGVRDHLLVLLMYRHGLRVSEAIALTRQDVDLDQSRIWISRLKNGLSVEQPIAGDELRAIRRWLSSRDDTLPWLFVSERKQPLTRQAVNYIEGFSLCFRSHQMLIGLLRSRHGSWTVPGDVRELLDLGKLVSSAVRQAGGPALGPD